jgi:hypothetical protein
MAEERLDLAVNIPATVTVKYADLVPSKHPEKYPAQVRFKGANEVGGQVVLYLDVPEVLRCLFACGAISEIPLHEDQSQIPPKGKALKLSVPKLTFLRTKLAKDERMTLSINGATADTVRDKPAAEQAPAAPANGTPAPANGNGNGEAAVARREKRSALYKAMTEFVLNTIAPMYDAAATTQNNAALRLSGTDAKEIIATLFIAETQH